MIFNHIKRLEITFATFSHTFYVCRIKMDFYVLSFVWRALYFYEITNIFNEYDKFNRNLKYPHKSEHINRENVCN